MNIPIYRAKKIDSDEYIQGYLLSKNIIVTTEYYYPQGIPSETEKKFNNIDQSTLAIHFPDMLDNQGNKIFASLSEDGKGGDIMKDDEYYGIAKYKDSRFVVEYENVEECLYEGNFEVIGIQEWKYQTKT